MTATKRMPVPLRYGRSHSSESWTKAKHVRCLITSDRMAERREFETLSFLGLVIGGILILVGGLMGALYMNAWGWGGMMSNGMMGTPAASGAQGATNWWFGGLGLLTGVVILIASSRIYASATSEHGASSRSRPAH